MANTGTTLGHCDDSLASPAALSPTFGESRRSLGLAPKRLGWEWGWLVGSLGVGVPLAWFTLRPPLGVGPHIGTLLLASLCFGLFLGVVIYAGTGAIRLMISAVGILSRTQPRS
jgi:hypothetical protein